MADTKVIITLRTKDGVKIGNYTLQDDKSAITVAKTLANITKEGKGVMAPTREAGILLIPKDVASSLIYFITEEPES